MSTLEVVLLLLFSAITSTLLTKLSIPLLQKFGFWNALDSHRKHKVVRGGGIAIVATALICANVWIAATGILSYRVANSFIPAAALLLIVGLFDDRFGIAPRHKLFLQLLSVALLYIYGYKIESICGWELPRYMELFLTLFWGVSILNASNLIDGLDGLCAGNSLIAGTTFLIIGSLSNNLPVLFFSTLLIAGCIGFLVFNFHPAKLFLGDTGSLFLGLVCTGLSLKATKGEFNFTNMLVMLMVFWIPFCDMGLAVWRRKVKSWLRNHHGKTMERDLHHLHYRLLDVTHRHALTVVIIWVGMLVIDAMAIWMFYRQSIGFSILCFTLLCVVSIILFARYELQYSFVLLKHLRHCFRKRYLK